MRVSSDYVTIFWLGFIGMWAALGGYHEITGRMRRFKKSRITKKTAMGRFLRACKAIYLHQCRFKPEAHELSW